MLTLGVASPPPSCAMDRPESDAFTHLQLSPGNGGSQQLPSAVRDVEKRFLKINRLCCYSP
ncbi:hypothetical protein C0J52_09620 [Blattella germanica]|nr:hypothetical protein C0J52_09620 [Blattella germanica]